MTYLIYLLAAYGLCFGFMNKATPLYGKSAFLDKMLQCSYCTGFHCGWMVWILALLITGKPVMGNLESVWGVIQMVFSIPLWAFASAVFCYTMDTATKYLESRTLVPDDEGD